MQGEGIAAAITLQNTNDSTVDNCSLIGTSVSTSTGCLMMIDSDRNVISKSQIGSTTGKWPTVSAAVYMSNSNNNTSYENNMTVGLTLSLNSPPLMTLENSSFNTFYHNDMYTVAPNLMSRMGVGPPSVSNSSSNIWDDGYPSGGNYWGDYNGTDLFNGPYQNISGNDGIGDTPYMIDQQNLDHYPVMNEIPSSGKSVGPVADFTYSPSALVANETVTFNASSSKNGWNGTNSRPTAISTFSWNFGDGTVISSVNSTVVHGYAYGGNFSVTLTVIDSENMNSSCSNAVLVIMPTSISVSTSATSSLIGYTVGINGTLSDIYGKGIGNEPVVLYYTFSGAADWLPMTSRTTDDNGQYSAQWIPTATGTFNIMAEWTGNTTCTAASGNVTLNSIAAMNQYVFSVESNSTISALDFNATSHELSFTASGLSGTTGYAKVTIAKSLVSNVTNIRVYLDDNQIDYSLASTDDSWLLMFNYMHSTHTVRVDLAVTVLQPIHDVAVTTVVSSKTVVGQGFSTNMNVTVANQGDYTETFNVTTYINPPSPLTIVIVINITTVSLDAGKNTTISLAWNTTGLAIGNYTFSAAAGPVLGETNTTDNTFSVVVKVTIPGDINGDFNVTLADLALLANAYRSRHSDANWNSNADINGNGVVGLSDLVLLAIHYGQHFP